MKKQPHISGPASAAFQCSILWDDELRAAAKSIERFNQACKACQLSPDSPPPTESQLQEKSESLQQVFDTCWLALHAIHDKDSYHLFVATRPLPKRKP